jgi:hypothetical protein
MSIQKINSNTLADGAVLNSVTSSVNFRNRIINGDMRIDQRNNGASVTATDAGYQIDRYQTFTESADGVFTVQRVADAPAGFINSAKITVTTADASIGASQRYLFVQNIEGFNVADLGFGAAGASVVTVSFWAKASVTGSFGGTLSNAPFNRTHPFNYTINSANTWEYKTITIAGDTSGTWSTDNSVGLRVMFGIGVGSNGSGPANAWAGAGYFQPTGSVNLISTLNATLNITGVQLEAGSVATPFERRPFGTELVLCQRYFELIDLFPGSYGNTGCTDSNGSWRVPYYLSVTKRATPSVTPSSIVGVNMIAVGGATVRTLSTSGTTPTSFGLLTIVNLNSLTVYGAIVGNVTAQVSAEI